MKRNILVFGLIAGVIVSTFMAISMAVMASGDGNMEGGTGAMILGFTSMIIAFSFVFVGIKNFRDKQNGGTITFGQGFLLGCLISLVASTLYVLTWAIEFHYFLPDFMDIESERQIQTVRKSAMSATEMQQEIKNIETAGYKYKHNPFYFTMFTYAEILPVGILISFISALILKRKSSVKPQATV